MSETRDPAQTLIWLAGLAVAGLVLVFSLVWSFASWRQPDAPGQIGEERDIGFFDPHLHVKLLEVAELGRLPETPVPGEGRRRIWVRLEARSSATEIHVDPSRLSVSLRSGDRRYPPLSSDLGLSAIDAVEVRDRFSGPLARGETEQAWFVFDVPQDISEAEIWLPWETWLVRLIPALEATPLYDKAVFALELQPPQDPPT